MPFFVWYMIVCAAAAAFWWPRDNRRAGGLVWIMVALPLAYMAFNYSPPAAAPHAMVSVWLCVPALLWKQGLMTARVAILGECIIFPYLGMVAGVIAAPTALLWGDYIGLSMLAAQIAEPGIGRLVGWIVGVYRAARSGALALGRAGSVHGEPE